MRLPLRGTATVIALFTLTACGGTAGGDAGGTGELTVAPNWPLVNLDPHSPRADGATASAGRQIFSRLVTLSDGRYEPDLATGWQTSPDGRTWTFDLRKNVKFSDGSALTSADVVDSVKRIASLNGPQAASWADVTPKAPSPDRVVLESTKPDVSILGKLTALFVTPAGQAEKEGFFTEPTGSGPFKVQSFKPNERLTLVPNEHYYGAEPKLRKLVFRTITEISARVAALRTGEVQAAWGLPDDQLDQLKGTGEITVKAVPSFAVYTMWFNSGRPAFEDAAVRRALWQAIDYDSIISSLYPRTGRPADSPVPQGVPGHARQTPVAYDPQAAKAALDKAGFDYSKTYELQFSGAEFRQFAQAVASDLAKIGVKAEPRDKEKAVFLDDLLGMRWDINLQSLALDTGDLAGNLGRLYPCAAKRTGYCNTDLDTVLARAGSTAAADERNKLWGAAQKIIWDDAVGMYPMFVNIAYVWRDDVHGLKTSPAFQPDLTGVTVS
ncbi:ABC transporter substrate-binding protein [Streptomyces sp. NPDC004629]|uniref:ABC transporter substrate-binding protein n=1 Tax=Streptomyces sp. NPDC004629 TaxID=3364705 RepID=UPI00368EF780